MMLNDKDMAGLTNRLQIPLIIQDVLSGQDALDDETSYGLHHVLSDQQPDSALLSIALGAHKIAVRYQGTNTALTVLKMEATRIIGDYAGLWLSHARHGTINEEAVLERLAYVPEDLQSLSELLEATSCVLQDKAAEAAELCRILMVQADAQFLIAESIAELIDMDADRLDEAEIVVETANEDFTKANDNIILFPA